MNKKTLRRQINQEIDQAISGGKPRAEAHKMILDKYKIEGKERENFFRSRRVQKRRYWSYLQANQMKKPRISMSKADGKK